MNETLSDYPRDMIGYGSKPVIANWPNKAKIAVQFVINYEEGGENCILHGDKTSESFLSEVIGAPALEGVRNMNMESMYEYGSRAGFWRLYRLFTERNIPVTVFGVATALARNLPIVESMLRADWDIASHGLKWIDYQNVPEDVERQHIQEAIAIHEKVTGSRPLGWYTGRLSPNTRKLVNEAGGFLYDSDSYADDLPYWEKGYKNYLIVPYTLDANDMRFATNQGFNTGKHFYQYLKDSFDVLREEGGRMMSIGLHCRLAGKPGRTAGLARFIDYIHQFNDIWVCRRSDIAQHWHKYHL